MAERKRPALTLDEVVDRLAIDHAGEAALELVQRLLVGEGDVAVRLDRQKLHEHDGPKDFLVSAISTLGIAIWPSSPLVVLSDPFEHGLWTTELFGNELLHGEPMHGPGVLLTRISV